ncbi:BnaC03g63370D [Brassica napus]|uniref:BnaC03g63370D protein n=1 Tax=Brassica napus TaxID=3708 RepID=A0A078F874_BRANA|nr:BnaC03g63370D [Brassica napus]
MGGCGDDDEPWAEERFTFGIHTERMLMTQAKITGRV